MSCFLLVTDYEGDLKDINQLDKEHLNEPEPFVSGLGRSASYAITTMRLIKLNP